MANMLLLSPGSKVVLAKIAAQSARKQGLTLHAVDSQPNIPTRYVVDRFHVMTESEWNRSLLEHCLANEIRLIMPTSHSDLAPLAEMKN